MKKLILPSLISMLYLLSACGGGSKDSSKANKEEYPTFETPATKETSAQGVGEIKRVELTDPLDDQMVKSGKMIYDMKCSACHKLTDQRVVGPGWANVTNRRTPEWIMNMITDTDMMLDTDPEAQAMLEQCLVRMPNQHLSVGDARNTLEFMRKNDVEQVGKKDEAK